LCQPNRSGLTRLPPLPGRRDVKDFTILND
jgi:hypothetical protein